MQELLFMTYFWLKAGHIVFVIFWMAGLFMLPRFFVYHQECEPDSPENAKWIEREQRRQIRAAVARGRVRAERTRLENQFGFLHEAHGVVARQQRFADARPLWIRVLDQPRRLKKIEAVRVRFQQPLDVHRVQHVPALAGQRMISPRAVVLTTVSTNELTDTYSAK